MLVVHVVLLLLLKHGAQETVKTLPGFHAGARLAQEPQVQTLLLGADFAGPPLPRRQSLGDELEQWECIDGRRGARLEDGRELVLGVVQGLHIRRVEAGAPDAVHGRQDDGRGVAPDVVVVARRVRGELPHGLGGLGALDRQQLVDDLDVEQRLHDPALLAPLGPVLQQQQVDLAGTYELVGDVRARSA